MLDVGFSEILLIFVLGLIVLGPEKLPRVAAQVGRWIGRARGMARQFREQLEEEVNLEQARKAQAASPPPPPQVASATPAPQISSAPPDAGATPASSLAPGPPAPPVEAAPVRHYPHTFSHAHPTDSEGRPTDAEGRLLVQPDNEPRQQDWVGGVTPAQQRADGSQQAAGDRGAPPAKGSA